MATPFPVPAPGDVWGQRLIDIITEHKTAAVEEALAAVVDPGSEAGAALNATYLARSEQFDRAGARLVSPAPVMLGQAQTQIVTGVSGASELREQDDIVWDPDDPNLDTYPEREFKFYFTAVIGGISRVYVAFSSDGDTFAQPVPCVMGVGDRTSEDPSITQTLTPRGKVYRDGGGAMYLYVEDKLTSTTYAYTSSDGVQFTALANNPAIAKGVSGSWDGNLTGSPIARHDGTRFIIGYEGVEGTNSSTTTGVDGVMTGDESLGIAYGTAATGLTKSPHNPVWDAATEPLIGTSLVVDSFFYNDDQTEIIFTAHNGRLGDLPKWTTLRGRTSNLDPLTWQSGDIVGFAGSVDHNYLFDFTVDNSHPDMSRTITQHGAGGGFVSRILAKVPASYGVPMAVWLDASSETQYANAAPLTTLTDRSGNSRHAVASGAPSYVASAINGRPAYRFGATATADHADTPAFNIPVPATAFVVSNLVDQQYIFDSATGQRAALGLGVINSGEMGFFNGASAAYASAPQSLPTGWHIWVVHNSGGPFQNVIYRDGVLFATAQGNANQWNDLRIGKSQDGIKGVVDIAEIGVATTALTLDRINRIGARLAQKYGLPWTPITG